MSRGTIVMLLGNALAPDPRVYNEARALVEGGFDVLALCWDRDGEHPEREVLDGIRIERIRVTSTHGRGATQILFMLLFWVLAFRHLLGTRPSAVHCHDFDTLPVGWLGARLLRVPVVYDAHESYPDMVSLSLPGPLVAFIRRWERWYLGRVDLVVTVGEILARHLRDGGARETVVVGNWKDPLELDAQGAGVRRELGVPADALTICFVANLGADRKVEELLAAAADLDGVWVIVGGRGPEEETVREWTRRCGNVRYLGFVDPERIPAITAAADIVYYGFDEDNPNARFSAPNKLFEALAAGRAVITGRFGEIGAIVAKHRLGVNLPSFSPETVRRAICRLRDDPDELRLMQARSRELGRSSYSLAMAQRRLTEAYTRLCPQASRRPDVALTGR